jgi:hypothetical protein
MWWYASLDGGQAGQCRSFQLVFGESAGSR